MAKNAKELELDVLEIICDLVDTMIEQKKIADRKHLFNTIWNMREIYNLPSTPLGPQIIHGHGFARKVDLITTMAKDVYSDLMTINKSKYGSRPLRGLLNILGRYTGVSKNT